MTGTQAQVSALGSRAPADAQRMSDINPAGPGSTRRLDEPRLPHRQPSAYVPHQTESIQRLSRPGRGSDLRSAGCASPTHRNVDYAQRLRGGGKCDWQTSEAWHL
ncbi:hypothetical protein OG609_42355 [Streptomyces sp. NBC_01224]|uniref:hypothetical protein n=1 Tax=Streptomyces sp. NBC_01224 TaxID=2903783 RepID=UPI002E115B3E|nr:hypothetical protein OG609_42355 [Streptomyces sp. NBC_01224]